MSEKAAKTGFSVFLNRGVVPAAGAGFMLFLLLPLMAFSLNLDAVDQNFA